MMLEKMKRHFGAMIAETTEGRDSMKFFMQEYKWDSQVTTDRMIIARRVAFMQLRTSMTMVMGVVQLQLV